MFSNLANVAQVIVLVALACQFAGVLGSTSGEVYAGESSTIMRRRGYGVETTLQKNVVRRIQRGSISGSVGLGNFIDLMYTVPIQLGQEVFALHLDTGSSDLWVLSDECHLNACKNSAVDRYPNASLSSANVNVDMTYGDSVIGSYASGAIGRETVTVAGIAMPDQAFALIEDTTNNVVQFNVTGILGLSFPSGSRIQEELANENGVIESTDNFVQSLDSNGPFLSRLAASGALESPMFSVQFQRGAIDVDGRGSFTIGKLPEGVDNSSLTWIPVRRYTAEEGGLPPPSFAPDEVYPYRWEVDIDGVFLDGVRLPDSNISADGVDSRRTSALIDTGNSVLRGPEDVVNMILSSVSPSYDPTVKKPVAALPCSVPRNLAFQIGGKMFPIDPRDFISQLTLGDAVTCQADNIVMTDPPSIGSLFRWSLGTPFFRSNIVAFHYGNLTHPSEDPPRIGFASTVPDNAGQLLQGAVRKALLNGGDFPNSIEAAPTASAAMQPRITVLPGAEAMIEEGSSGSQQHVLSRAPIKARAGACKKVTHDHGYILYILLALGLMVTFAV